jgi:hypothetical protein
VPPFVNLQGSAPTSGGGMMFCQASTGSSLGNPIGIVTAADILAVTLIAGPAFDWVLKVMAALEKTTAQPESFAAVCVWTPNGAPGLPSIATWIEET